MGDAGAGGLVGESRRGTSEVQCRERVPEHRPLEPTENVTEWSHPGVRIQPFVVRESGGGAKPPLILAVEVQVTVRSTSKRRPRRKP